MVHGRSGIVIEINKPLEDLDENYDGVNIGCLQRVFLMVVHVNYITVT